MGDTLLNPVAEWVWQTRYRRSGLAGPERCIADTMTRVAGAVAAAEPDSLAWRRRFKALLRDCLFLPGGRILAAAGVRGDATLLNCFVMGQLEDAPRRFFRALGEGAHTLGWGGGVGWDFSTLAPHGTPLGGGRLATGPLAALEICDLACQVVNAGSLRGGAMMGSLSVTHPDVLDFIEAKSRPGLLPRFNLSLQVTDEFMRALHGDAAWSLSWRRAPAGQGTTMPSRLLWARLLDAMLRGSEPGVLFIDTINRENNLYWRERLATTNPCGEAPLPPYGACDLGSINLAQLVRHPFTPRASLDLPALRRTAATAVRLLDDVLDVTRYPLPRQKRAALATRRVGLGITGLGDALAMLGLRYDSQRGRDAATRAMEAIKLSAYAASADLAREKGPFPAWDRDPYLAGAFVSRLPGRLRDRIAAYGIRNSHLLAIAPTGSVSLLAGNVSPGVEPIPALAQRRRLATAAGETEAVVLDHAWQEFQRQGRKEGAGAFVEAADVPPAAQIAMQAALQRHVDGAISKTLLVPPGTTSAQLGALLDTAHGAGLKGIAVYRPGSLRGSVVPSGCAVEPRGRAACEPA